MPLVTFINEVFAERLGMSFTLSAGLAEKTDLVTLRLTEPVPPNQLFATARRVLGDYGVNLREADGVLTFVADQEVGARDIPLLISGRALPEVPPTHRTAFQLVPMHVGRANIVAGFLNQAFGSGRELDIRTDIPSNTLLLRGTMEMLERAAEMIEVLDHPLLRGRHGVIIDPSFLAAADLATDLEAVLAAEGYSVGTGGQISTAVILLPLRSVNKLVAFASDAATLNHIREWARTLDAQKEATVENAVFTYEVRNTQAASMQRTLEAILEDGGASPFQGVQGTPTDAATEDDYLGTGRIVVDENRNMLLFRGSGKEWAELHANRRLRRVGHRLGATPRGTRAGPRNAPMAAVEASKRRTGPGRERRARWRGSYGPGPRASASNTSSSVRASSTFSAQASRSAAGA